MKKKYGVVHGLAECLDCEWKTSSYKNAQANAARHARAHGHKVTGEVGNMFEYDGRGMRRRTPMAEDLKPPHPYYPNDQFLAWVMDRTGVVSRSHQNINMSEGLVRQLFDGNAALRAEVERLKRRLESIPTWGSYSAEDVPLTVTLKLTENAAQIANLLPRERRYVEALEKSMYYLTNLREYDDDNPGVLNEPERKELESIIVEIGLLSPAPGSQEARTLEDTRDVMRGVTESNKEGH